MWPIMNKSSTILGWGHKGKKSGRMRNSINLGILFVCFLAAWFKLLCSAKLIVLTMMSQSFCVPNKSFLLFKFQNICSIFCHRYEDSNTQTRYHQCYGMCYRVSQQLSIQETSESSEPPLEDSHQTLSWKNFKKWSWRAVERISTK